MYVLIEKCLRIEVPQVGPTSFEQIIELLWQKGYTTMVADHTREQIDRGVVEAKISIKEVSVETVNFLIIPPSGNFH